VWLLCAAALLADAVSRQQGPSTRNSGLIISEIMYHPAAREDNAQLEFVEVVNTEPVAIDVGGYRLSGQIDYSFPPGTVLAPHAPLVVALDPAGMEAVYGIDNVLGPFTGRLANASGTVRLRNAFGAVLLEAEYSDRSPYPVSADGGGHSLTLARPDYGERDPAAWAASSIRGGTPGLVDSYATHGYEGIVINEFLAHTDLPELDYVELYNAGSTVTDLGACVVTDTADTNLFVIPLGTTLSPGQALSWTQDELGFSLSMHGGTLFLISSNQQVVIDALAFEAQANGRSMGRFPDGTANVDALSEPTPGTLNSGPWSNDIVINEIMYHPLSGLDVDEYIELHNRGDEAVDVGHWQFTDGVAYMIPSGTVIEAGEYLVVAKDADRLIAGYRGRERPVGCNAMRILYSCRIEGNQVTFKICICLQSRGNECVVA